MATSRRQGQTAAAAGHDGLSGREKGLASVYREAAGLGEATAGEYAWRSLLVALTGHASLREETWTHQQFRLLMAVLERRVEETFGGDFDRLPRCIRDLHFWRNSLPVTGRATKEQLWRIAQAWGPLAEVDPATYDVAYLLRMAARACHLRTQIRALGELTVHQASLVLDAVQDHATWLLSKSGISGA